MGEVIRFRRLSLIDQTQGKTLCKRGFHKWGVAQDKQFDVKRGRLVTVLRCRRCGAQKVELG